VAAQPGELRRSSLGPLKWDGDTALQFPPRRARSRSSIQYLKDGAPPSPTRRLSHLQHRLRTAGIDSSAGRWLRDRLRGAR
jgi:hypothetical protein